MKSFIPIVFSSALAIASDLLSSLTGGLRAAFFVLISGWAHGQSVPLDSVFVVRAAPDSIFTTDFHTRLASIESANLLRHVREIASPLNEGRATGTPGYWRAAESVAGRFRAEGWDSLCVGYLQRFSLSSRELRQRIFIPQNGPDSLETANVVAWRRGRDSNSGVVVITAHLDHLGRNVDTIYAGANDNASGISILMEMARLLKNTRLSVALIAFSGEEAGLLGSRHFVEHPLVDLGQIRLLINLDLVGSGRQGIMVQGVQDFPDEHARIRWINDKLFGFELGSRPNSPNSDQYYFNQMGLPAFFFYSYNGAAPYHSPFDTPDRTDPAVLLNVARFAFACAWWHAQSR